MRSSTCTRAALALARRVHRHSVSLRQVHFVLIPSFQFGGMEHAGAIFYNAASLMLDETATQKSAARASERHLA